MGLFSSLFGGNTESTAVTHPCTNCASDCSICPAACDECREYKEKLTDLLYNVEHIDAFRAKYEVVSTATESLGSCTCEACGGPNPSSAYVCEYCGTALRESTGKILVTTANDIPNPILEAQDLIFERFELQKRYLSEATESSGGLFSALSSFFGSGSSTLGDKMTEDEISKAAELYEVSVSSYLQGLDNGKYLTYARKKQKDLAAQQAQQAQQQAQNNAYGMGAAGVGAAGMMGGGPRPPMGGQPGFHGQQPPHPQGQGFGGPNGRPGQQQPQRPAQQPAQRPAQQPAQRPVQQQTQRPAQQPARPTAQQTTQRPVQQQTQRPAQQAARPAQPTKPANNMPTRPSVSSPLQKNNPVSRPAQNSRPAQPSGARPTRPGTPGGINKGPGKK